MSQPVSKVMTHVKWILAPTIKSSVSDIGHEPLEKFNAKIKNTSLSKIAPILQLVILQKLKLISSTNGEDSPTTPSCLWKLYLFIERGADFHYHESSSSMTRTEVSLMDIKRHIILLMKCAKKPSNKQKTNNRIFTTSVKFAACMTKKWKEHTNKKNRGTNKCQRLTKRKYCRQKTMASEITGQKPTMIKCINFLFMQKRWKCW